MSELVSGPDASNGASNGDEKAAKVGPAGIDIAYQRFGKPDAPAVLLIMGIAAQSIAWPDAFCQALVDSGLQVIRFDNRDVGISTHLTEAPPPNLPAALAGDLSSVAYTLSDMADDAVGAAGRAGLREGTCRRRVHGRRDCANDGNRASGSCPLAHLDDVDNGQDVSRAALAGRAPRSIRRPTRSHSRRSDSADGPGFPRGRLAWISER